MRLVTQAQIREVRKKAVTSAFAPAVQRLRDGTAQILERPVRVPRRQAGYYHEYFCPEHAVQLVFDWDSPAEHRCPHDGKVFSGEPYDSARNWFVNHHLSEGAFRLGLLWQLTREDRYLERVREILLEYAGRYGDCPPAPQLHPSHPGRVTWSCLDESVWAVALTWAFDLVRDALERETAEQIETQLLRPAAAVIQQHMYRHIHNVACWNIAAIGTVGIALDDEGLVRFALEGEYGFAEQMEKGVLEDGMWFEGSLSYHYYTLAALMVLARATQNSGFDLRSHSRLQAMFEAPISCAYPDLTLPAINDCWYFISLLSECGHGIPPAAGFYELAYSWYGKDVFAWILQETYSQSQRDSVEALLYGVEALPPVDKPTAGSVNLEPSGQAVLRSPGAKPNYALLTYGPYAGAHDHPDKLNLIVFANGERMSPDLGTPGYGIELNEAWYRQTLSHNTVVIDGQSQGPCCGNLRQFVIEGEADLSVADAEAAWAEGPYGGVHMRRTLLWRPDYWVDVFQVVCDRSRQIDWFYHNVGELTSMPEIADPSGTLEDGVGYSYIEQANRQRVGDSITFSWLTQQTRLNLFLLQKQESEVITGVAPYNPASAQIPLVLVRRQAQETTFVCVFFPSTAGACTEHVVRWVSGDLDGDGFIQFAVDEGEGTDLWVITRAGVSRQGVNLGVQPSASDRVFKFDLDG